MRFQLWTSPLLSLCLLTPAAARAAARHSRAGDPQTPSTTAAAAGAATTAGPTSYDVVSIHDHAADDHTMMWRFNPDGILMTNVNLQALASDAYDIKQDLVTGGPSWVGARGFDISAKLLPPDSGKPIDLEEKQRNVLLRALLADRFHLQARVETKTLPIFELVVAKSGVRLKSSPPPAPDTNAPPGTPPQPRGSSSWRAGHLEATDGHMTGLAGTLGVLLGKTVLDKTSLPGDYDYTLDYTPDDQLAHPNTDNGADLKPDIFTALQEQLGLKLVPVKGPVRTLVIDHAELPTPN